MQKTVSSINEVKAILTPAGLAIIIELQIKLKKTIPCKQRNKHKMLQLTMVCPQGVNVFIQK